MTILVIGGATTFDDAAIRAELDRLLAERPFKLLLHLSRRGTAACAGKWATENRVQAGSGGPVRERDIMEYGSYLEAMRSKANDLLRVPGEVGLVVRFPGGDATDMLAKVARACGVEVMEAGA